MIYWMVPDDTYVSAYLVRGYDVRAQRRVLQVAGYEQYRCGGCGKVDEYAALRSGVSPKVRVKAKGDFLDSADDVAIGSRKLRDTLMDAGVRGADFLPIPSSKDLFAMVPSLIVPTNEAICASDGMKLGEKCGACGRYREISGGWPVAHALSAPSKEGLIFSPSLSGESTQGRRFTFYVTEDVKDLLVKAKISGVDQYMSLQ